MDDNEENILDLDSCGQGSPVAAASRLWDQMGHACVNALNGSPVQIRFHRQIVGVIVSPEQHQRLMAFESAELSRNT